MGTVPSTEVIRGLGFPVASEEGEDHQEDEMGTTAQSNLAAVLPLLTSLLQLADSDKKGEQKLSRFPVAKGLPTLPTKLVDRAWKKEYVDMEEFLPTSRSLRLAEQGRGVGSLQESLAGALSQFQAMQQQQKAQHPGLDVLT